MFRTDGNTTFAADTFVMIDGCLTVCDDRGIMGADACTGTASDTVLGACNAGSAVTMLLLLTFTGTAAHTDIFHSAAEAGGFVALKVRQGNKDICIHDGAADLCFGHVISVDRNFYFIGSLQTVRDQYMTAGLKR